MKKALIFLAILSFLPACFNIGSVSAAEIESSTSAVGKQEIFIKLAANDQIVSVVVIGSESGDGLMANPYVTRSKAVRADIVAAGIGTVRVMYGGNVLWSENKTVADLTTLHAEFDLPDGVGLYDLIVELFDGTSVVAEKLVYISWRQVKIGPDFPGGDKPGVPGTGFYVYLGKMAVAVNELVFWVVLLVLVSGGVWFVHQRRRKEAK